MLELGSHIVYLFFGMFMYISWICKCTFDILDYQVLLVVNFNEYGENDGVLFHVS